MFLRFENQPFLYLIYAGLYEIGLLSMIYSVVKGIIDSSLQIQRAMLGDILLGTLAFVLLAFITVVSISSTKGALPSVMCHYALILAVFLFKMLLKERKLSQTS